MALDRKGRQMATNRNERKFSEYMLCRRRICSTSNNQKIRTDSDINSDYKEANNQKIRADSDINSD